MGIHASPTATARVAVSVCSGHLTYNEIMADTGYKKATIHAALLKLRDEGIVDWEPTKVGTMRAFYKRVDL